MHWISFKNKPEDYNDKMGEGWHMFTICVSYLHNCYFNECVYSFVISDFNPVARYVNWLPKHHVNYDFMFLTLKKIFKHSS